MKNKMQVLAKYSIISTFDTHYKKELQLAMIGEISANEKCQDAPNSAVDDLPVAVGRLSRMILEIM